jgi:AraC-like DNA-binding protein
VKQPGDVHRDLARPEPTVFTVVTLPAKEVARAQDEGATLGLAQLDARDPRAAPFHRLLDVVGEGGDRLTLEVAVTEAVSALVRLSSARLDCSLPVRRARDYIRARLGEAITLDDLAAHAGLDKFHLCRAFRAQIGMPPHAYLTHLRIARAKELLLGGMRASEVAHAVGLYDQAQLTRHFRRLVGTTPARYGRSPRAVEYYGVRAQR